jgi:beta-lactam-binding protein with PASTA domain
MPKKTIKEGNKEMEITTQVKDEDAHGSITELELKHGKDTYTITEVSDGTIIKTKNSPGCSWYFFAGSWYYICS